MIDPLVSYTEVQPGLELLLNARVNDVCKGKAYVSVLPPDGFSQSMVFDVEELQHAIRNFGSPSNGTLLTAQEAAALWNSTSPQYILIRGNVYPVQQLYSKPCRVFGMRYFLLFKAGDTYLCLHENTMKDFEEACRAKEDGKSENE